MLKKGKTYEEVYGSFQWKVPTYYNIGVDCCDKWADAALSSGPDLRRR